MLAKRRSWKNILKIIIIIPAALLLHIDCFLSSYGSVDIPVEEYFAGFFVGRVTEGDITTIVFAMENLAFVLLFIILFGNSISEKTGFVPAYYFTRERSRGKWFAKECVKLSGMAAIYVLLYCAVLFIISCTLTGAHINRRLIMEVLFFFAVSAALIIMMTVLANILTLKLGTAPAFICVCVIVLGLCILAISCQNPILNFINPMCYVQLQDASIWQRTGNVIYDYALAALTRIAGSVYMSRKDI